MVSRWLGHSGSVCASRSLLMSSTIGWEFSRATLSEHVDIDETLSRLSHQFPELQRCAIASTAG